MVCSGVCASSIIGLAIPGAIGPYQEVAVAQLVPVRVGAVDVLVEAVTAAGSQPTSAAGAADRAASQVSGAFERAQATIEEIAVSTARTLGNLARRVGDPAQVELEFGLKLSAKGDVIIAGVSAESSLKVKIVYGAGGLTSSGTSEP
jgi:hypothetical protein